MRALKPSLGLCSSSELAAKPMSRRAPLRQSSDLLQQTQDENW